MGYLTDAVRGGNLPVNEPTDEPLPPEVERFLDRLQRGEQPDPAALLADHPEWAPLLDCLIQLDGLAGRVAGETPPLADSEPCADFGDYELLEEIGRGGMGVVFRARQKRLGRIVALKMVLASRLASPESLARFALEAQAAARLRHPQIVSVYDAGQRHGQHYYAMQYVAGSDLAQLAAAGPLDPKQAARTMALVARAVQYLHEQGIVHRDLKPSNILLDETGNPQVADFGLAKLIAEGTDLTQSGTIVGTAAYMAPEQARGGRREVGPSADVYSLGAILFELLTGRPPFESAAPLDVLLQLLGSEPPQPRQLNRRIPLELELIVLHCLEKAPRDRYRSAAALADDLERYLRGEPLEVRPAGWGARLLRWARREPALAGRFAAGGLFYLVQLANRYYFYRGDEEFAGFHRSVSLLTLCWMIASVLCQVLVRRPRWKLYGPLAWTLIDCSALASMLVLANGPASPLVVVLPLLIVGSGLWFRPRLVATVTAATMAIYLGLVVYFRWHRTAVLVRYPLGYDHHAMFLLCMLVSGLVTGFLTWRIQGLGRRLDGSDWK